MSARGLASISCLHLRVTFHLGNVTFPRVILLSPLVLVFLAGLDRLGMAAPRKTSRVIAARPSRIIVKRKVEDPGADDQLWVSEYSRVAKSKGIAIEASG